MSVSVDEYSSDEEPLAWNEPEPEKKEVTEAQLREFEKTFSMVKQQLAELTEQYDTLRSQFKKEQQVQADLKKGKQALEDDRNRYDHEMNLISDQTAKPAKTKQSKRAADQVKIDMYESQMAMRSINEMKARKQEIEHKFQQEKSLWNSEKVRLTQLLRKAENENAILKQTIDQFATFMKEKEEEPEEPDMEVVANPDATLTKLLSPHAKSSPKYKVVANPDAKLTQILSPVAAKQSPRRQSPLRGSNESLNDTFDREVMRAYKQAQKPPPSMAKPTDDMFPPEYTMEFDYFPDGEGTPGASGKEVVYDNGDIVISFRNGTKKIKRGNDTHVIHKNGDVSITYADGAAAYRYRETKAIELTLANGTGYYLFANGQYEVHYPSGDKYVIFPNKSTKYTRANGDYQIRTADGRVETCVGGVVSKI